VRKHAHGPSLTQAGRQFLAEARSVPGEAEGLNRLAATISGNVQGPLTVGCRLTLKQALLPAIRRRFQNTYPDVGVSQVECDQATLIEKLRRAEN